ncbi:pentatricopeptide (PPR) domain protein 40 [Actinidia rufa]|uniref:Pentatricopeptide (PPR) domain protein 40 n=1 Tax=Actinidia rufa TaxID=165716 RepID=A0A7J0GSW7_9ERIC|nr:pentatricopeptide (PPR) domain protein 40 [Actinidia rufa]
MRGVSSLVSRASPAIRNLSEEVTNPSKTHLQSPSNSKSPPPLHHKNPPVTTLYLPLKFGCSVSCECFLQNQENPLHPLRFYIWVSNINPLFAKNQTIRSVLGNGLYRKGPLLLSVELVQDIRDSGCRVTEDLVCVLIGSWGRLGLAKYCAEVFGQISYLGLNPTTRLYNAVIHALVKSNSLDFDLAYLKFQQMSADNCTPDRYTYNTLIHGVCKVGVVDEALRLVRQMEGLGYLPNVITYTMLVDGFCNAKKVDEAFKVFEKMKERNVHPNDATFRSLVNGVFRCVLPCKAFELLSRFVEREPILPKVACDTILHCLSSNSLSKEVAEFLRNTKEKCYLPDSSTINISMTCLIKGLDLEEACDILDSFTERAKMMDRASETFGQMRQCGIVFLTLLLSTPLFAGIARLGRLVRHESCWRCS